MTKIKQVAIWDRGTTALARFLSAESVSFAIPPECRRSRVGSFTQEMAKVGISPTMSIPRIWIVMEKRIESLQEEVNTLREQYGSQKKITDELTTLLKEHGIEKYPEYDYDSIKSRNSALHKEFRRMYRIFAHALETPSVYTNNDDSSIPVAIIKC